METFKFSWAIVIFRKSYPLFSDPHYVMGKTEWSGRKYVRDLDNLNKTQFFGQAKYLMLKPKICPLWKQWSNCLLLLHLQMVSWRSWCGEVADLNIDSGDGCLLFWRGRKRRPRWSSKCPLLRSRWQAASILPPGMTYYTSSIIQVTTAIAATAIAETTAIAD